MAFKEPFLFVSPRRGKRRFAFFLRVSGRWFFGFSVFVGLVTMMTENNVLFFMASLLFSVLTLSSALSDFGLYGLRFSRRESESFEGSEVRDVWVLHNPTPMPMMALQFGEFRNGAYEAHFFLPYLRPFAKIEIEIIRSNRKKRGRHDWDSLYVMSSAPFGYSEKYFHSKTPGSRMVWPERKQSNLRKWDSQSMREEIQLQSRSSDGGAGPELEGLDESTWGADARHFYALRSDVANRQFKLKRHARPAARTTMILELKNFSTAEQLEKEIRHFAKIADRARVGSHVLMIKSENRPLKTLTRRREMLDALACVGFTGTSKSYETYGEAA